MSAQLPVRQRATSSATANHPTSSRKGQEPESNTFTPKSSHVSDPFLQPFLNPAFDPAAYLNASLPALQHGNTASTKAAGKQAASLSELSGEAQALTTQLDAHTTRLTNTLTQLTDDILRSGSRLAYEVELLRGETLALAETFYGTLKEDTAKFVPGGLTEEDAADEKPSEEAQTTTVSTTEAPPQEPGTDPNAAPDQPDYAKQLRALTTVRDRLDSAVKTFGQAMDFVFPPSELSVSSSFLSVSAPEPGKEQQSSEEKGQQVLKELRDEIAALLADKEDPIRGIEKAALRVAGLKELLTVWKGTAEEKGRTKFVESLARAVEDAHKELVKGMETDKKGSESRSRKNSAADAQGSEAKAYTGGYGLISQLQKIRSGLVD